MFPLMLLIALISVVLFIVGFVCLFVDEEVGLYVLLAMILLPGTFIGSAIVAKQLELGAYREEPMTPIIPPIANKVIFRPDTTDEQVRRFWRETLSEPVGATGELTRPGIRAISSSPDENGRDVVLFAFSSNATEAQKADMRSIITSCPQVEQYLENVEIKPVESPDPSPSGNTKTPTNKPRKPNKVVYSQ